MELINGWIEAYGYFAIYGMLVLGIVGLPIPDEMMLMFAGYSISMGRLDAAMTWSVAVAGSASGITISYLVGRTAGHAVLIRYGRRVGITEQRLDRVRGWFARAGHWTLTFGYFIAGFRHFTALVAGLSGLGFRTFGMYAWSGTLLWVSVYLSLGYFLGENWETAFRAMQRNMPWVLGVLVVIGLGWLLFAKRKRRIEAGDPPSGNGARE